MFALTSEPLLVEDDIAETLKNFATAKEEVNRQMYGRALVHVLRQPLNRILQDMTQIISTLLSVSEDEEPTVRAELIEQIPSVFIQCYELTSSDLETHLYDRLLGIVFVGLRDHESQVRKSAYTALCLMIEKYLIDIDRLEGKVCPSIVELSKIVIVDSQYIDYHTIAVGLMSKVAPVIGSEKTAELILERYLELCDDEVYYVRRVCATYFPDICKVMKPDITESRLLNTFVKLCNDNVWGVRKACCESLPIISLMCSYKIRWEVLTPILLKMLEDASRWVSTSAYKVLGQFISSFAKPLITGVAYTPEGELHIVNTADENFKDICDSELVSNFEFYEKMFLESTSQLIPPPPSTKSSSNLNMNNNNIIDTSSNKIDSILTTTEPSINSLGCSFLKYVSKKNSPLTFDRVTWCDKISKMTMDEAVPPIKYDLIPDDQLTTTTPIKPIQILTKLSPLTRIDLPSTQSSKDSRVSLLSMLNLNNCGGNNNNSLNNYNENNENLITNDLLENDFQTSNSNFNYQLDNKLSSSPSSHENFSILSWRNKSERTTTSDHLKKTPSDLPSIINLAIINRHRELEEKNNKNITLRRNNNNNNNKQENIKELKNLLEPPETPSIEKNSPPKFVDYSSALRFGGDKSPAKVDENIEFEIKNVNETIIDTNKQTTTEAAVAEINDENDLKSSQILSNLGTSNENDDYNNTRPSNDSKVLSLNKISDNKKLSPNKKLNLFTKTLTENLKEKKNNDDNNKNDDDEDCKFNNHQFWYISPPVLPLELEQLIECGDKSSESNVETNNIIESSSKVKTEENSIQIDLPSPQPQQPASESEIAAIRSELALATLKRDLILGPSKYKQNVVPPELLENFVTMLQCTLHNDDLDYYSAYNFPAVLLTIGRDNWNFMCDLMNSLCSNKDYKIRQTMAASIYQIAQILGKELTTRDLVPLFVDFFNDLDEVKAIALKNLSNFLKVIDRKYHDEIITYLEKCLKTDNETNWRFREELANQVLELIKMYENTEKTECLLYLTGLSFRLLMDKVNSVRDIAFEALVVRSRTCTRPEINYMIKIMINEFAKNIHWRRRQSFVILCHKIILEKRIPHEIFVDELLEELLLLASDSVPNIRLVVAKCFSKAVITHPAITNADDELYEKIVNIILKFRLDEDSDVREMSACDEIEDIEVAKQQVKRFGETFSLTSSNDNDEGGSVSGGIGGGESLEDTITDTQQTPQDDDDNDDNNTSILSDDEVFSVDIQHLHRLILENINTNDPIAQDDPKL